MTLILQGFYYYYTPSSGEPLGYHFFTCNVNNCADCSWINICSSCLINYTLVNNTCVICDSFCDPQSKALIDNINSTKNLAVGLLVLIVVLAFAYGAVCIYMNKKIAKIMPHVLNQDLPSNKQNNLRNQEEKDDNFSKNEREESR